MGNGRVYEEAVIVKLFHNESLQDKYLPGLLTGIFTNYTIRRIAYLMVLLNQSKKKITLQNLIMMQSSSKFKAFTKKMHSMKTEYTEDNLTEGVIADIVMDVAVDSSTDFFDVSFRELHDICFANFTEDTAKDFTYSAGYKNVSDILYKAKSILRLHTALYRSKVKEREDQIENAFDKINSSSSYIRTSSERLNFLMGGWSKGYAASAIGRPSHNKSTWFTFESMWQVNYQLDHVDVIGAEETIESFWRRVFAIELSIPIKEMAEGVRRLTPEELNLVRKKYEGKLRFHPVRKYEDVTQLISTLKTPYIWIDHINALDYPRGDMYNGIQKLINFEKEWLASNRESVIINLSQVNTKKMQYQKRLFPAKEDAYMSSILEQASREFISFYYPYKDYTDSEFQKKFIGKSPPSPELVQMSIEKNSLGDIGIIDFVYEYLLGKFRDAPERKSIRESITDSPEFNFDQFMSK
jgi:replicative DNA helicase